MDPDIEHIEKIVPDAYHGTTRDIATRVLAKGKFEPSKGKDQWLGDGVYFFESSAEFAKKHVDRKKREGKIPLDSELGVICATINLGRCLDLCKIEHTKIVENVEKRLLSSKTVKKEDITDAVIINLTAHITGAEVVRKSFQWTSYKKVGKRINIGNPMFICVREQRNILKMELV
jgi:hypothetical protein